MYKQPVELEAGTPRDADLLQMRILRKFQLGNVRRRVEPRNPVAGFFIYKKTGSQ